MLRGTLSADAPRVKLGLYLVALFVLPTVVFFYGRKDAMRAPAAAATVDAPAGKKERVDDFRLLDQEGRSFQLSREKHAPAVVIFSYGIDCPIARKSIATIKELHERFAARGVVFWLLDGKLDDERAALAKEAQAFGIDLPILTDPSQAVSRALGFTRTAEALVVSPSDRSVLYRGAIDDQGAGSASRSGDDAGAGSASRSGDHLDYGAELDAPRHRFLSDALDDVLSGRDVRTPHTEARGCAFLEPRANPPTYTEAAAILRQRCAQCHRGDGPAWAMRDYAAVRTWLPMMRDVLLTARMPPWQADPSYGSFEGELSLPPAEMRSLFAWMDAGAPRGVGPDSLQAPLERTMDAKRTKPPPTGEPDMMMRFDQPVQLPANGIVPYKFMAIANPMPHDVFIRAVSFKMDNPRVIHHLQLLSSDIPLSKFPRGRDGNTVVPEDMAGLVGWVPGAPKVAVAQEDTGILVEKGRYLVANVHYTTTGKPEVDRTSVGFYLYPQKELPSQVVRVFRIRNKTFSIPPGARDFPISASKRLDREILLYAFHPHMHVRGKSIRCRARFPDGTEETLLSIPVWDFTWQRNYLLKEPRRLPAGTELLVEGTFDNSADNPKNPDPSARVEWGPQTTDEMLQLYVNYIEPRADSKQARTP